MSRARLRRFVDSILESRCVPANLAAASALLVDNNFPQSALPTPVLGQRLFIQANWTTTGLTGADQYPIRIAVDGVAVDTLDFFGAPGTNVPVSGQLDGWYATAGSHTVNVTLDPANVLAETDEGDNTVSFTFTTGPVVNLPNKFLMPMAGKQNEAWSFAYYQDVDPRPSVVKDYRGNEIAYDYHDGWDVGPANYAAMDRGIAVSAAAAGTVIQIGSTDGYDRWADYDWTRPNNWVYIDHGGGWTSFYGHMGTNSLTVKVGDVVRAGQIIGLVGSSGNSAGPHFHFTSYYRGCQVETAYDYATYWHNPPVYPRDNPPSVTDFGVTNLDMFTEANTAERLEDVNTFQTTTGGNIYFWYYPNRINAGETINVHWTMPDNSTFIYGYTPTEDLGGSYWQNWTLFPGNWTTYPGTWQVALTMGAVQVASKTFTVSAGAGVASARVFDSGGGEVANGRTTPLDIGSAPLGGPATNYTFSIFNHGTAPLNTSGLQLPTGFALSGAFPSVVAANSSATFTVQLLTAVAGRQFGDVRFTTDDPESPVYDFNIGGTVTGAAPAGAPVIATVLPSTPYYFGGGAVLLNPAAVVTDGDSANFAGGSLLVELASGGDADDRLAVRNQGIAPGQIGVSGANVTYGGTTIGTMTGGVGATPLNIALNANATPTAAQALVRNLTYNSVASAAQTHRRYVRLTLTDNTAMSSNRAVVDVIHAGKPAAPRVAQVQINGGAAQRSRVTSVAVVFDEVVSLPVNPADAFSLVRQGSGTTVALTAAVSNGTATTVTLTFNGAGAEFTSLADGRYTLTVDAASVVNAGLLDGNGDGFGGDNFVLASDASPNPPTNIFRLFGDLNGDGFTDNVDLVAFRLANGSDSTSMSYNAAFDENGDGFIDNVDLLAFRQRLGVTP